MAVNIPLLLENPHGGTQTPPDVVPFSIISEADLDTDGDEFAGDLYTGYSGIFELSSAWWRAYLDPNRDTTDFGKDGVVKTHTSQEVQIYTSPEGLPQGVAKKLIQEHIVPYRERLAALVRHDVRVLACCHTMPGRGTASSASSRDVGSLRPLAMIGTGGNTPYLQPDAAEFVSGSLRECMKQLDLEGVEFEDEVRTDDPYAGALSLGRVQEELASREDKMGLLLEINRELVRGKPHNIEVLRTAIIRMLTELTDGLHRQV